MERATKLIVLLWTCAALAFEVHLVARAWGDLQTLALLAFLGGAALAVFSSWAPACVLAFVCIYPAAIWAIYGDYNSYYATLWMAGLLGTIVPNGLRESWHIPHRWRAILIACTLITAIGASIAAWREIDFNFGMFEWSGIVWSSQDGGPGPIQSVTWILQVSSVSMLGVLWFDWLFSISHQQFRQRVAVPFLASMVVMSIAAVYQMSTNVLFLNPTIFGGMHRAAGTMLDGNVCGMLAAFGIAASLLWGQRARGWWFMGAVAVALLAAVAVWGTGSRTAFVAAFIIAVFAISGGLIGARLGWRTVALVALLAAAIGALTLSAHKGQTASPAARLTEMLPRLSVEGLTQAGSELWNRNRYGAIASSMFQKYPLFGVGIGCFQIILPDFAERQGGFLTPDNAQNWYRQQVVELGVVGSAAWLLWVVTYGLFVVRRRTSDGRRFSQWVVRGALIAFGLISLVGMPGQDISVVIVFWTLAYWFVAEVETPQTADGISRLAWAVIVFAVVLYGAGATVEARTRLRVPHRAQQWAWRYSYGFYDPETGPDGTPFRWATKRAAAVIPVESRWVLIQIAGARPAGVTKPLEAKVWRDGKLVIQAQFTNANPISRYVFIDRNETMVLLETWSSDVFRPRDFGSADDRELGLQVSWRFVPQPPPDTGSIQVR